jgi:hypothetical protein
VRNLQAFLLFYFLFCFALYSQNIDRKTIGALRINSTIKIDGFLEEEAWKEAPIAKDFVQNNPYPGKPASQQTEVKILYDDVALYVGATMYDLGNDAILRQLSKRDQTDNTDVFAIYLDTYNDRLNAFQFMVTASGVQVDIRLSPAGNDVNWNAVWYSEARIDESNWYVEMKIPFSAIRFPKKDEQVWGINFQRGIRRFREDNYWNKIDPLIDGFVNQFGELHGIREVEASTRLFFYPYASSYVEHTFSPSSGPISTNTIHNGGMDIKYGVNDAFTLDVTLIPDFGQVLPDNEILNLTPFEVFFNERRQFFTEGTELFNKGGIFYSRRIGGRPMDYWRAYGQLKDGERIIENPRETRLINSSKLSGRTNSGLGIGVLNSVTAESYATIENNIGEKRRVMTNPLSNYNVFVLDQSLKNNSFISFINTNVWREGSFYDANVSATEFKFLDQSNTYVFNGTAALSQRHGLFNASTGEFNTIPELGHRYFLNAGKVSGNFQYSLSHKLESNTYSPNDLGFLGYNNEESTKLRFGYNVFNPYSIFLRTWSSVEVNAYRLYRPTVFTGYTRNLSHRALLKSFTMVNIYFNQTPNGWKDYFETRSNFQKYYQQPAVKTLGGWISSDYSRVLALDVNAAFSDFDENNRRERKYGFSPRWRVSDQFFIMTRTDFTDNFDDIGFVNRDRNRAIIFGQRDRKTIENLVSARYNFNPLMDLSLRLRHYWSKVVYLKYHQVGENGALIATEYNPQEYFINHDVNFNVWNIDLAYTWVFTPGSELSVVWKNVIMHAGDEIPEGYFSNVVNLLELPQMNSISVKALYFVDYLWLKKKK